MVEITLLLLQPMIYYYNTSEEEVHSWPAVGVYPEYS